jgi:hypothetical protein
MQVPLVAVTIDRGTTVIATQVPEHEVDVLRAVHGVAEVQTQGDTGDTMPLSKSADDEWARLTRKYKRINSPDPVSKAYRTGPAALEAFGFHMGRGASQSAPQSGVRVHPKPEAEKPAKKAA